MGTVFLVVHFTPDSLYTAGFEGRDEIEDPLHEALVKSKMGEVTGGGSGYRGTNIDVEVDEQHFDAALSLLRKVLQDLNVPADAEIKRFEPDSIRYPVYAP